MNNLMWFRQDLRVYDNTALSNATSCKEKPVIAVFCACPKQWQAHDMAACRVDFMLRNLKSLSKSLEELNIPLKIIQCDTYTEVPEKIIELAIALKCDGIYSNKEYGVDELQRDSTVDRLCKKNDIQFLQYHDEIIIPPEKLKTKNQTPYTVYTPFRKSWVNYNSSHSWEIHPAPKQQQKINIETDSPPTSVKSFKSTIDPNLWPAGEITAHEVLNDFIEHSIYHYHEKRDFPNINATSVLSPYLAAGVISIRQCLKAALSVNNGEYDGFHKGVSTWINELIWREFYRYILICFPRVSKHKPFLQATENIPWENNHEHFQAWQQGLTGYPIVDAAMRQLNQTGWMHNRLRMISAMFLTKNLFVDWRWGERYFMQHLIDGDLASNNGGWQWSASTGNDAAPYFRIFNPLLQSKKFDAEGTFIKKYLTELKNISTQHIHEPHQNKEVAMKINYPPPIVDYTQSRKKTIAVFSAIKQNPPNKAAKSK